MNKLGKTIAILLTVFATIFGVRVLNAAEIKPVQYLVRTPTTFGVDEDLITKIPGLKVLNKSRDIMLVLCNTNESAAQLKAAIEKVPDWKLFKTNYIHVADPRFKVHSAKMGEWITTQMDGGGSAPLVQFKPSSVKVTAADAIFEREMPVIKVTTKGHWRYMGNTDGIIVKPLSIAAELQGAGWQGSGNLKEWRHGAFQELSQLILKKGTEVPVTYQATMRTSNSWEYFRKGQPTFLTMRIFHDFRSMLLKFPVRKLKI